MGILGDKEIKYSEKLSKQEKFLITIMHKSRDTMQLKKLKGIFDGFVVRGFFMWNFIVYFCQNLFSFINLNLCLCKRLDEILIDLEELFNSLQETMKTVKKTWKVLGEKKVIFLQGREWKSITHLNIHSE